MQSEEIKKIDIKGVAVAVAPLRAQGRKAESEAAERLVRDMIGEGAVVGHTSEGAPMLAGYRAGALSISHCRGYVAVALSSGGRVGIDVETPRQQLERVARRFLSEAEMARYAGLDALLRAWTAKEAVYKAALHPGLELVGIKLPIGGGSKAEAAGEAYELDYAELDGALLCLARHVGEGS